MHAYKAYINTTTDRLVSVYGIYPKRDRARYERQSTANNKRSNGFSTAMLRM